MTGERYGVRGPDPRNTVVTCESRDEAVEMLLPGDVVVVSVDSGRTWRPEGSEESDG